VWTDNETGRDFLNFGGVAESIAQIIVDADTRPVSIGVSGSWGVGKSSMIKLTRAALEARDGSEQFLFVEFNAWLYQGYDDARTALLETIADRLIAEAAKRETGLDKAKDFLSRVKWLRLAKLVAIPTAAVALGLPPVGLAGDILGLVHDVSAGTANEQTLEDTGAAATALSVAGRALVDPKQDPSPPKQIEKLRASFEETLDEMGVTLVLLVDDLDRCLPDTAISTLEAIRLFLFLRRTAFVIAADDGMIKHAVRKHFEDLKDESLVTNYFDKLIQIPIRVPALGTQEVRAYMMMLFIENSSLNADDQDRLRAAMIDRLRESWRGRSVNRAFVAEQGVVLPPELVQQLTTAERLAPVMTSAGGIAGNPRLIKRFLNALDIRMSMAKAQGVDVDEQVLAKLLLFERLASPKAYLALTAAVNADADGKPRILEVWEREAADGKTLTVDGPWTGQFLADWIALAPPLADQDLRGALYVGRENAPLITDDDRLSSDAAGVLAALLDAPREAHLFRAELRDLARPELAVIMDRLLAKARQETEWGTPAILDACLIVAEVDPDRAGQDVANFLNSRPAAQIGPGIVPRIADYPWAQSVFDTWNALDEIGSVVKNAIKGKAGRGNV
jgi:predicted KAP-like P-loop ATPase